VDKVIWEILWQIKNPACISKILPPQIANAGKVGAVKKHQRLPKKCSKQSPRPKSQPRPPAGHLWECEAVASGINMSGYKAATNQKISLFYLLLP
jgi:hypothetical protein